MLPFLATLAVFSPGDWTAVISLQPYRASNEAMHSAGVASLYAFDLNGRMVKRLTKGSSSNFNPRCTAGETSVSFIQGALSDSGQIEGSLQEMTLTSNGRIQSGHPIIGRPALQIYWNSTDAWPRFAFSQTQQIKQNADGFYHVSDYKVETVATSTDIRVSPDLKHVLVNATSCVDLTTRKVTKLSHNVREAGWLDSERVFGLEWLGSSTESDPSSLAGEVFNVQGKPLQRFKLRANALPQIGPKDELRYIWPTPTANIYLLDFRHWIRLGCLDFVVRINLETAESSQVLKEAILAQSPDRRYLVTAERTERSLDEPVTCIVRIRDLKTGSSQPIQFPQYLSPRGACFIPNHR